MLLNVPAIVTVAILAAAILLFVTERIRADIVALLVLVVLGATGILTPQEAFSGFSRSAVVTIAAIFVLAEGLHLTGASERVGDWLVRGTGRSEGRLVALIMGTGAFLSLFMNNIAAASVLLPAVSGAARRTGVSPSRLLMPLAFATILGGMATLFTTTNIVVSGLLRENGLPGFGVLEFAPVGIPAVAAGILYMVLWGRKKLPARSAAERFAAGAVAQDLTEVYGLGERLFRIRIPIGSYLHGEPLMASALRERFNVNVVAIEHAGTTTPAPTPDTVLRSGDVVTLDGDIERFREQDFDPYFEILPAPIDVQGGLKSVDVVVAETVLTPRSNLIGRTLKEANFREKFGFTALAIWRAGKPIATGVALAQLQFGDALLLQGPRERLAVLRVEPDLIVLDEESLTQAIRRPAKMRLAVAIMFGTLLLAIVGSMPTAETMLAGSLVMILTGCLTADEAYGAVEWKSVFLVAGMLPMGLALSKTGVALAIAGGLVNLVGTHGWFALMASLFLITLALTQIISGPVVATIVVPIAIQSGRQLGVDPSTLAFAVALATSVAFLTPLGHPVNVLVMGPGGYAFSDYFKVGAPLTIIVTVVLVAMLWLLRAP